jgi:hypothetical protein
MTTGRINQVRLAKRASATGENTSRHENTGSEKNEENFELVEEQISQLGCYDLSSLSVAIDTTSQQISLTKRSSPNWDEAGFHLEASAKLTANLGENTKEA